MKRPFVCIRFHGVISREIAEKIVMAAGEGSYLTRESRGQQRGNYAISLRYFHSCRFILGFCRIFLFWILTQAQTPRL